MFESQNIGVISPGKLTLDDYAPTSGQLFGAAVEEGFIRSPGPSVFRAFEQSFGGSDDTVLQASAIAEGGHLGLDFQDYKDGIRRGELDRLIEWKKREKRLQRVLQSAPPSAANTAITFGGSFIGGTGDPLNIALSMIPLGRILPGISTAAKVSQATSAGRRAVLRAQQGLAEGVAGAAIGELPVAIQAAREQADYTLADSVMNLAFGGVMGAGFSVAGGVLRDVGTPRGPLDTTPPLELAAASPPMRDAAMRVAAADAGRDLRPSIQTLLRSDPKVRAAVSDVTSFSPDRLTRELKELQRIGREDQAFAAQIADLEASATQFSPDELRSAAQEVKTLNKRVKRGIEAYEAEVRAERVRPVERTVKTEGRRKFDADSARMEELSLRVSQAKAHAAEAKRLTSIRKKLPSIEEQVGTALEVSRLPLRAPEANPAGITDQATRTWMAERKALDTPEGRANANLFTGDGAPTEQSKAAAAVQKAPVADTLQADLDEVDAQMEASGVTADDPDFAPTADDIETQDQLSWATALQKLCGSQQ